MAGTSARSAKGLYVQVLAGAIIGAARRHFWPAVAVRMQPFDDAFIKLVRMVIAAIVFVTVVVGIAKLSDAKEVGRIGIKSILYFEVLTTIAMFIGLVVAHVLQPGAGLNIDPATLDGKAVARYADAPHQDVVSFLLNVIPNTVMEAFAKGEIPQVLLLTSKGAASVTGGGFIALAATLTTMNGKVPVAGMVLVLGIDRFMSEARAITNLFGNTVATIFVAWWEGTLDLKRARAVLDQPGGVEAAVLAE